MGSSFVIALLVKEVLTAEDFYVILQPEIRFKHACVLSRHSVACLQVLFKIVRHLPRGRQPTPVLVHINYHPDKLERMKAVFAYYLKGNVHALEGFPGGSEPGS